MLSQLSHGLNLKLSKLEPHISSSDPYGNQVLLLTRQSDMIKIFLHTALIKSVDSYPWLIVLVENVRETQ